MFLGREKERMAVGQGLSNDLRTQKAVLARPVINNDRLAEHGAQSQSKRVRDGITGAIPIERGNQPYRLCGKCPGVCTDLDK
jgi:hypothetical protein